MLAGDGESCFCRLRLETDLFLTRSEWNRRGQASASETSYRCEWDSQYDSAPRGFLHGPGPSAQPASSRYGCCELRKTVEYAGAPGGRRGALGVEWHLSIPCGCARCQHPS